MWNIFFLLACAAIASGELLRLRLHQARQNGRTIENLFAEKRFASHRYAHVKSDLTTLFQEQLHNSQNLQYYGYIYVGSPPQLLKVAFDIGSPLTWVLENEICNDSGEECKSGNEHGFNISASSTFINIGQFFYSDGSSELISSYEELNGLYGTDMMTIGGNTIKNQMFGYVFSKSDPQNYYPYLGSIGLASNTDGSFNAYTPLQMMQKQELISEEVFSMYFSDNSGEIIFGGSDSTLYNGELTYIPATTSNGHYTITLNQITINGMTVATNLTTTLESTISFITVPLDAYIKVNEALGSIFYQGKEYIVDCSTLSQLPGINFQFGDLTITLGADDYIQKVKETNGEQLCVVGIKFILEDSSQPTTSFILGQILLNKIYAEYDLVNNRVGLATPLN